MTPRYQPQPGSPNLEEIFAAQIQVLQSPHRYYRVAAHRFLAYLQTDFPQVRNLADVRRDPHLLGWIHALCQEDPPLSHYSLRIYVTALRRLLRDLAPEGGLIRSEDFPLRPPQRRTAPKKERFPERPHLNHSPLPLPPRFGEIFDARIRTLATTLRPDTINTYRVTARRFLSYLQADFPQVCDLSELRRDPHLLGWVRSLDQQNPPLSQGTREQYLYKLRCLLQDLVATGHSLQPSLILPEDFPPRLSKNRANQLAKKRINHQLSNFPFGEILEALIQTLATTLAPRTIDHYRTTARCFSFVSPNGFSPVAATRGIAPGPSSVRLVPPPVPAKADFVQYDSRSLPAPTPAPA